MLIYDKWELQTKYYKGDNIYGGNIGSLPYDNLRVHTSSQDITRE